MHFGLSVQAMRQALQIVASRSVRAFGRDEALAQELGIGTVQVEALAAWLRLAALISRTRSTLALSAFGRIVHRFDGSLTLPVTWWAIHVNLAREYSAWYALTRLPNQFATLADIEGQLASIAPGTSSSTLKNARVSVVRTLDDTPLGQQLGLFRLEGDGKKVTGLTKLPVRHGQAPMAAVGYAILDWARREKLSSVGLTSLAAPDGPGPILHMSEGVLERYLIDLDGAYRGRVLTYSRTADLNEAYFRPGVTPLQVLASHYLHEQEGLDWPEALCRAAEEVPGTDDD
jgi:hypothetical protein